MSQQAKLLGTIALSGVLLVNSLGQPQAQVGTSAVAFRPHRAVYDITFDHATPGSGVADMTGRMVYEMTGGGCSEYAQSMRFVTRMTNQEGVVQINDLRTSSFEDLATHKLPLDEAPHGYEIFQKKQDGAIKVLLEP